MPKSTFIQGFAAENHGSPPLSPVSLDCTGITNGNKLFLFVMQSAVAGDFTTITPDEAGWVSREDDAGSWGVSIQHQVWEKTADTATDNTVSVTFSGGTPLLVAMVVLEWATDLGTFEGETSSLNHTTPSYTTALDNGTHIFIVYRPNATPANFGAGPTADYQTTFAGQIGGEGVAFMSVEFTGPGGVSQYSDTGGDNTLIAIQSLFFAYNSGFVASGSFLDIHTKRVEHRPLPYMLGRDMLRD